MQEPMSVEGYDVLVKEFKFLLEVEKPKVAHEKLVAAALGDRSENADYQAAKEKLRHIDKRLLHECPHCHRLNVDYMTRIIGYL